MDRVEVVVAHAERATLRVGDVFLKVDPDLVRTDREVESMARAPVPTAEVLWRRPPVLALAALEGTALGRLGEHATTSPESWVAAGATVRALHDAPAPPWDSPRGVAERAEALERECAWLLAHDVLPADLVRANREIAEVALQDRPQVFAHGDLQVAHVFVRDDEVTGVLDWSEAGRGDATYDLATLTLGHRDRLDLVLAGYGDGVDRDAVSGWWSLRSLTVIQWLLQHGFDPAAPGCEVDVLRAQAQGR